MLIDQINRNVEDWKATTQMLKIKLMIRNLTLVKNKLTQKEQIVMFINLR